MPAEKKTYYPSLENQVNYPALEETILQFWKENKIFEQSVNGSNQQAVATAHKHTQDRPEFVFYDGPPFANGLPHYGHLLTGYIKDLIPRYRTMRGEKVRRRFGWDCHGLPAEMETEKELGVSGRMAVEEYGIGRFNEQCRKSVLKYTREWQEFVERQARWVDFEDDYKTLDVSYMESVLWAFKQLWEKGLVYEGYKVVPYSWACETPLSNFETRVDNAYRLRQDPALTVKLKVKDTASVPTYLIIWTTTPWTLPSNLAVAAGAAIPYVKIAVGAEHWIMAESALARYEKEIENVTVVGHFTGAHLENLAYEPLFPYFAEKPNAFKVLLADFVSSDDGTGLVHLAPGFGEDDQRVCNENGIEVVCPIDSGGKFVSPVEEYIGLQVFEANKPIIHELKQRDLVVRHETIDHNYPHCWRTDTPLIYKAVSSWYVAVSKFKSRMVELNQEIRWMPEHIKDGQFGRWLENARDWAISRTRFWGSPIPVWRSDSIKYPRIDVYGSIEDLERDFGVKVVDLHRPFIDTLTRKNPDDPTGESVMRRVSDVFDCWFESGSMPFAQLHYPFENVELFEKNFPADFIVEYVSQTRGWFYTLMVLSTALFDRPPFRNCICHGVVLDENGKKLSKRLKNYPSPQEVFSTLGSDALRWYLVSSTIVRGGDIIIDSKGKGMSEVVRSVLNPLWNAYYFFCLYANADGSKGEWNTTSKNILDKYILAKTHSLIVSVEKALEGYDIAAATQEITYFFQALNNWYIRRSRDRFWKSEADADKQTAYDTLYVVLATVVKIAAPFLPLISEVIFKGLTKGYSVHLESWPLAEEIPADAHLVDQMDLTREICSVGLSLREEAGIRTRQPLASLILAGKVDKDILEFADLIKDELNVKEVQILESFDSFAERVLQVDSRKVGPRVGGAMKTIMAASRSGAWEVTKDGRVLVAGIILEKEDFQLGLKAKKGVTAGGLASNQAVVILDTVITAELKNEGYARDLVRAIQQTRKDSNLHVSDKIDLMFFGVDKELQQSLELFKDYIKHQTLGLSLMFYDEMPQGKQAVKTIDVGSYSVSFAILLPEPGAISV
jgi:isoleucyl-tRNA synthetase